MFFQVQFVWTNQPATGSFCPRINRWFFSIFRYIQFISFWATTLEPERVTTQQRQLGWAGGVLAAAIDRSGVPARWSVAGNWKRLSETEWNGLRARQTIQQWKRITRRRRPMFPVKCMKQKWIIYSKRWKMVDERNMKRATALVQVRFADVKRVQDQIGKLPRCCYVRGRGHTASFCRWHYSRSCSGFEKIEGLLKWNIDKVTANVYQQPQKTPSCLIHRTHLLLARILPADRKWARF